MMTRIVVFLPIFIMCWCISPFANGLPGEAFLTLRWRDLLANYSALNNPAFLTEAEYLTARGAFSSTVDGSFNLWELGATIPVGKIQSLGVTWVGEGDGTIQNGVADASSGELLPLGKETANQNHVFLFSYAIKPVKHLSLGVNVNVVRENNFGNPMTGYGCDLGASYSFPEHPIFGENRFGLMLQNLVPPKTSADGEAAFSSLARVSWLLGLWDERIESGLDASIKDLLAPSSEFTPATSDISLAKKAEIELNYRLGFWILKTYKIYGLVGLDYWGVAAGIDMPAFEHDRALKLYYQYMNVGKTSEATSHSFYLVKEFGNPRSESGMPSMTVAPNDLYTKAKKLYFNKNYWDAFYVFTQIQTQFPSFFKNDWVSFYRASCLEELDMRQKSEELYKKTKKQYGGSLAASEADLGLMRLYYRNNDWKGVTAQYKDLDRPKTADTLKYHALYLMGSAYLALNENKKAAELFSRIPPQHPTYIFAQHSMAVAAIRQGNKQEAFLPLENCIGAEHKTPEEEAIFNRSLLFIGYLAYENNLLSKAVKALKTVSKDSYYYTDALLGQGWTAVKARQKDDCIGVGRILSKACPYPVIRCEGMLIESYGYFMAKNDKNAIDVLEEASDILDSMSSNATDTIAKARVQNGMERADYNILSKKMEDLSLQKQTSDVLKESEGMHDEQKGYLEKLQKFQRFSDEYVRATFFGRTKQRVMEDVNYLLAKLKMHSIKSDQADLNKESDKESKKIDDKIEKLEKKLKEINQKDSKDSTGQ